MKYDISRYLKHLSLIKYLKCCRNRQVLRIRAETARNLIPDTDLDSVKAKLQKTGDAYSFMSRYLSPVVQRGKKTFAAFASAVRRRRRCCNKSCLMLPKHCGLSGALRHQRNDCAGMAQTSLDGLSARLYPINTLKIK